VRAQESVVSILHSLAAILFGCKVNLRLLGCVLPWPSGVRDVATGDASGTSADPMAHETPPFRRVILIMARK
jgi:hypothetical protein